MREVDQKDQSQKKEKHGAEEGNIVAVDKEEGFGDEEGHHHKRDPEHNLWTPEAILNRGTAISGCLDTQKQEGENQVEESKPKVDAVDRHPTVTFLPVASDLHIIEGQVLQLLECPRGEHNPGNNGVD